MLFFCIFDRLEDANEYHIRARKAKHQADAMVMSCWKIFRRLDTGVIEPPHEETNNVVSDQAPRL